MCSHFDVVPTSQIAKSSTFVCCGSNILTATIDVQGEDDLLAISIASASFCDVPVIYSTFHLDLAS